METLIIFTGHVTYREMSHVCTDEETEIFLSIRRDFFFFKKITAILDSKERRNAAVCHDDSECSYCSANKAAKISNIRPHASWNDLM